MNLSETNRVKLVNKREIPQEVIFKTSLSKRDSKFPNRYNFVFPPQWTKLLDKDAIFGIRSIFLTKKNRFIKFKYYICLSKETSEEYQTDFARVGTFGCFIDQNDSFEKVSSSWSSHWLEYSEITDGKELGIDLERYDIVLNYIYKDSVCYFMLGILLYDNDIIIIKNGVNYRVSITLEGISDDFRDLFGDNLLMGTSRIMLPCWSRKSCMVTSSIGEEDAVHIERNNENYISYTRDYAFVPIKYYRITSKHKTFWIDLWDSRDNSVPVKLPEGDEVWIEAVILFNANSIL